jgi:peptidyl-prolyl cis-trans isomerase A (cyclophilin A)
MGGPGYTFRNETIPELTFDRKGLIAMANSGPDTNGSQFFITYAPAPNLNDGYTIFGEVVDGMDVAESLTPRDTSQGGALPPGDVIFTIKVVEE